MAEGVGLAEVAEDEAEAAVIGGGDGDLICCGVDGGDSSDATDDPGDVGGTITTTCVFPVDVLLMIALCPLLIPCPLLLWLLPIASASFARISCCWRFSCCSNIW